LTSFFVVSRSRYAEILLFLAAFFTFVWFHQGGGWNQNSRFAQVRSIVEEGRFAIDDFLVYRRTSEKRNGMLTRVPIRDGDVVINGMNLRLCWVDSTWRLRPVNRRPIDQGEVHGVPLSELAASGDVSFKDGHFYPNKPPGAVFAAVPPYWLALTIERMLGFDRDDWWILNFNLWFCTVFSNGLISALGVVVFFRTSRILASGKYRVALATSVAFAFGTMYLPFATVLFDHNLTAVSLLLSFYLILESRNRLATPALFLSGLAAGFSAITNYLAAVPVAFLWGYLFFRRYSALSAFLRDRSWVAFAGGVLLMLAVICVYNSICFGAPTAISNSFQDPGFDFETPRFLGMFGLPDPGIGLILLISPYRGIFFTSPLLILGVWGLVRMRRGEWRVEAYLFGVITVFFFFMNVTFFGWHGGFTTVSRYLIPALPFLALPLVLAFQFHKRLAWALAGISIFIQFLITAVDVQAPAGVGSLSMIKGRAQWNYNPFSEYIWPLFTEKRAWPILHPLLTEYLEKERARLEFVGFENLESTIEQMRRELLDVINSGRASPILLAAITGPVSANVVSPWAGEFFHLYEPGSEPARWASFNVGEFVFPESRLSLLPVIVIAGSLVIVAFRRLPADR
jgi:hypothetical protein